MTTQSVFGKYSGNAHYSLAQYGHSYGSELNYFKKKDQNGAVPGSQEFTPATLTWWMSQLQKGSGEIRVNVSIAPLNLMQENDVRGMQNLIGMLRIQGREEDFKPQEVEDRPRDRDRDWGTVLTGAGVEALVGKHQSSKPDGQCRARMVWSF